MYCIVTLLNNCKQTKDNSKRANDPKWAWVRIQLKAGQTKEPEKLFRFKICVQNNEKHTILKAEYIASFEFSLLLILF